MKKTVSLLSLLLSGCVLYAGPVTPEKALQVARSVFALAPSTKAAGSSELSIVWDGEFEHTRGALDPAFYVVTRPEGGFVMVAGNDNVQPVLGFSFENDFVVEDMPENVRWWMEQYKQYVRSAGLPSQDIYNQWAQYVETKGHADPVTTDLTNEFLASRTNEWNQTNPANFYCPNVDGQEYTSVCGCVALATAEVMAWFGTANIEYATGTVPSYTYTSNNGVSVTVPAHDLGTHYEWTNLKNLTTYSGFLHQINGIDSATPETYSNYIYKGEGVNTLTDLGRSLAQLVYDIGTILRADYNDTDNTGTGAYTEDVVSLVGPIMGYNNTARYVDKMGYSNGQWSKMMKDEITLRPVIYTGNSSSGGHAYVADGYANYGVNLLFHFNLGWGGSCNGYYTLDIQDDYDVNHCAIFNFYPNPSSSTPLPTMAYSSSGDGGIEYVNGYNGGTLQFNLCNFFNAGVAPFSGDIYAVRKSVAGVVVESTAILTDIDGLPIGYGWPNYGTLSVGATTPALALGDYLEMYYKESGKDTYLPFIAPSRSSLPRTIPFFPAAAIKKNASYSVGDYFVFELTNNSYLLESTDTWRITTPGGTTTNYTTDDYQVQLTESGEYKITCTTAQETLVTFITVL